MALKFASGDVLEHPQLNNMILAMNNDGVLDGLAVSQRGAGANMSVDVASGNCYIDDTKYTEASTVNLVIEAAHATLYRKDLITYDPTTSNPVVTKGTDHAGGTGDPIYPPDIPAGDILLAIVDVDANVSSIVNADIHDGRAIVKFLYTYSSSASDVLKDSNDSEETFTVTSYTKQKDVGPVPKGLFNGTLRIKFALKRSGDAANIYGKIYRNGAAVGTERMNDTAAYVTYSEDIPGWNEDDTIELWCYRTTGGVATGYCKEFRVYCDHLESRVVQTAPSW